MYGSLEFNEILDEEVCVALGSRAGRQPTLHVWSLYRLPACSIDCDFSVRVSNTRLVGCVRYSGTQDKVHGSEPSPYNDGMGVRRGRKAGLPARRSPQHRYCISICAQPRCCAICIAAHIRPPASVYTEMNAVTKGASLGIFDETRKKGMEASQSGSQPYVDLMGRRSVKCHFHLRLLQRTNVCVLFRMVPRTKRIHNSPPECTYIPSEKFPR